MTNEPVEAVLEWFRDQQPGWTLTFDFEEDLCWAHLGTPEDPRFHPRYGSGADESTAALSAKRRYETEQIGAPNEGQPRHLP